jgi:subtilisin family serine protease
MSSKKRTVSKRKSGASGQDSISREVIEELIYGRGGGRRFTQDSPVLPDVWIDFGKNPAAKVELLINPHIDSSPEKVAHVLRERLASEGVHAADEAFACERGAGAGIAYNQSTVVARLCFHELVRAVLPLTPWWNKYIWWQEGEIMRRFLSDKALRARVAKAMSRSDEIEDEEAPIEEQGLDLEPEVLWMMRVIGTIAAAAPRRPAVGRTPAKTKVVDSCAILMESLPPVDPAHRLTVWSVTRNRRAEAATWRSTMAVKADAARRLFEISCRNLTWAILDSGIDATHPAFRARGADGKPLAAPFLREEAAGGARWRNQTRVSATYDFSLIRYLLTPDDEPAESLTDTQRKHLRNARRRLTAQPERAKQLRLSLQSGRSIDWDLLRPLLEIPHDGEYVPPKHDHGTHVAGILAADWAKDDPESPGDNSIRGVCPDIRLYDLRVLDEHGGGDEFSVIAALQFVRHLNAHKDVMVVHGVNMSLSIRHDVANYACGRTPVCEEAERLVGAGVVVVAAAGNNGYLYFTTASGAPEEGYRSISITDPGNAEAVITVGATHREQPHTYGVSYFSSRGPTGDGRIKPDLVAPGEKIVSVIPGGASKRSDGTSMAAPHVSGAAALLMARYQELVGRPNRIKEILSRTATDLGREKYFQGAGMLDILRALQSV